MGEVLSQHALQVVSQHALQQVSRRGVVFQHALQVSRPTPKGEIEGDLARGVSRPTIKGEVEGHLARGVSRPTPKGEVEGDLAWGGLKAHTWGVWSWGCLLHGGCLLQGGTPRGGVETPHDGYCCERYASYWNAFL